MALLLAGCALVPIQDRTLTKDTGGTITCKQVGVGAFSFWIGKARYNRCVSAAQAQGFK